MCFRSLRRRCCLVETYQREFCSHSGAGEGRVGPTPWYLYKVAIAHTESPGLSLYLRYALFVTKKDQRLSHVVSS